MKRLLDQYGIHHYVTQEGPKAAVAKWFNRMLKELTYKDMTAHNTLKYLDVLPKLLAHYNQRLGNHAQCDQG